MSTTSQSQLWRFSIFTLYQPISLSYRNPSIDMQSKSMDWFLYERDIGR